MARFSGSHGRQVGLPYLGADNLPTVPQAGIRGRRRRQSQSRTPDSRSPSTIISQHYLPPTSAFSRSRPNSRSTSLDPQASTDSASAYQTQSRLSPRGGSSTPYTTPLASLRSATPELRSNLEHHAATFVAVDPFLTPPIIASGLPLAHKYGDTPTPSVVYPSPGRRILFKALVVDVLATVAEFVFDHIPRQLYLYFLLRLPYFYFSRVARIFEEAEMTMLEIKEMAVANAGQLQDNFIDFPQTVSMGPHMLKLKASWEGFIESLVREWKTLNIISVLLLSYVVHPGGLHFFLMLEQGHSHNFTDSRCRKRSLDAQFCTFFSHLRLDESVVRVHVHYTFRDHAKTPQSHCVGRGKLRYVQNIYSGIDHTDRKLKNLKHSFGGMFGFSSQCQQPGSLGMSL